MNKNDDKLSKLMHNARKIFISDVSKKTEEIISLVDNNSEELSIKFLHEVLKYFHSINGTAGTLEFEELSSLCKSTELELEELTRMREKLDEKIKDKIMKVAYQVDRQISLLKTEYLTDPLINDIENKTGTDDLGKILLIDDDIITLKLLEGAFTAEGYTVYICDDSLSAMDVLDTSHPDIILLDIMMPKCDGYELLTKIKENPQYSDIPVVFLSAMDDLEAKLKGMKAGVDDYITKPFSMKEIVPRVEMILRRTNKLKEKLVKDSLTGAYSRYYLNEKIEDVMEKYRQGGSEFSIAFLDIDFFKEINDSYGHNAGDFVLKELVKYLNDNLRDSDYVFRYGGEEFIVLLQDTDEKQAYAIIDRVRENFTKHSIIFGGRNIDVTFSAGVIQVTDKSITVQKLLNLADEAMYLSKKSGRNKVTVYSNMDEGYRNKKSLLLVDDESTLLKLLNIKLTEVGYNINTAADGRMALELINNLRPDAIILDRILPDMDGLDVCRAIKQNPDTRSIPIIILSQKKSEDDIAEGIRSGADDYVSKPFSISELEERIFKVLNR